MEKPILYNAWFCPFAQRAWISMEHNGVDYEYAEQDPYDKTPEWLAINPRGLVPAIKYKGNIIYESSICIEYVDEQWPGGNSLLPSDSYSRAWVRIWSDHVTKKIVPHYYALLMKRTDIEREAAKKAILDGVKELQDAMNETGPFFTGTDFGLVDIMMAPFALRLQQVASYYRSFTIPDDERFTRYHKWWRAVLEVPAVKATVQPEDKLIKKYKRYEDDSADTEVATAIRKGTGLP